ncbi:SDR family NAD(P)-dependent oxidoreductase [Tomitella biformata]|uniref:SDR family NAD(P)-dependent oxidoreductase n=1 Tax=Tomitella biformata TaxID=630403 RepID=UPI0004659776|nr:SDR family NAD(P)-dependent oxidoreductase [Tomitella biformata]
MSGVGDVRGKIAVVTGGAAGIGYAIAESLTRRGAVVVIADVEPGALAAAAEVLGVVGVLTDVSQEADLQRLADEVRRLHGRLDIAVNNAGVARVAPFEELTTEDFRWVLDVNLWGVIHGMRTFLPLIEETSECGYIVNTASIAGVRTAPRLAAYAASKFGVLALTETLSQELAARQARVGVGVLVPAMVKTNIATSERNRPAVYQSMPAPNTGAASIPAGALDAASVGEMVVDSIERGDLYIVTHPDTLDSVRERHRAIEEAFEQSARVASGAAATAESQVGNT